jgi:hypothetical protein
MFYSTNWNWLPGHQYLKWLAIIWLHVTLNHMGSQFQFIEIAELV